MRQAGIGERGLEIGTKTILLVILAVGLFLQLSAAEAQQTAKTIPRIGFLAWDACPAADHPYLQGLRDLGYAEGKNVVLECRMAGRRYEGLAQAAKELAALNVDVIIALSHPAAKAASEATKEIPIVMVASGDPVGAGLVASLAHPGGNVTGLTYYATELTAKRLQLLREAVPGIRRIGVLHNPALSYLSFLADSRTAATALGLQLQIVGVSAAGDLSGAFSAFARGRMEAVFVLPDLLLSDEADRIATLALAHKLPTMAWGTWFAQAGGLAAYSGDYEGMDRRAAGYTDRILKGAKPADLPIEQPTKFKLAINLKTAKALGLTIPHSLLIRADEVIQ